MTIDELIELAQPELIKSIKTINEEMTDTANWLEQNQNSEDAKVASQVLANQNKMKRLTDELSSLQAKRTEAETISRDVLNGHRLFKDAAEPFKEIRAAQKALKALQMHSKAKSDFEATLNTEAKKHESQINHFKHMSKVYPKYAEQLQ